jgi:hypothetical protein
MRNLAQRAATALAQARSGDPLVELKPELAS